jgi:phage terminase small subunit
VAERWTDKREQFLRHYVSCGFNATEAARRAGYRHPNKQGPALVKLGIFQERLEDFMREVQMSREECLMRMARIVRTGMTRFYTRKEGHGEPRIDWDAVLDSEDSDLVLGIRPTPTGMTLVGMDRLRALEMVAKSHALFVERVLEERADQAVSNAALEQALERLRAYQSENAEAIRDWHERVRQAGAEGHGDTGSAD